MYLKDVLDFFDDQAEYIEAIEYDGDPEDFKMTISVKYEDEVGTAEIYLFSDGESAVENIKSCDSDDYSECSIINGKFIELIANFIDKWRSLKVY